MAVLPVIVSSFFASVLCSLTEGDETGVMDSLMEALQSGAAFRDRRKRTPRNGKAIKSNICTYEMSCNRCHRTR